MLKTGQFVPFHTKSQSPEEAMGNHLAGLMFHSVLLIYKHVCVFVCMYKFKCFRSVSVFHQSVISQEV